MKKINFGLSGYKIVQIANRSHKQMMAYVIITPNKKAVLVDVGREENADYLVDLLLREGCREIELVIITHCHMDHFGGLYRLTEKIKINKLCYYFPPAEWVLAAEPSDAEYNQEFFTWISTYQGKIITPTVGDCYEIDGLKLLIMKDCRDYLEMVDNPINDTSIVLQMEFPNGRNALFLADLGEVGGARLAKMYGEKLKADIVQMAHHGQEGVSKEVYELIQPEICLWAAPDWLWDNNYHYLGYNSGPFKTLEVREWMDELNVKVNANQVNGDVEVI